MARTIFILLSFLLTCIHMLHGQGFAQYLQANSELRLPEIRAYLDTYFESHEKGRGSGYKQYQRWVEWAEAHTMADGTIANHDAMNIVAHKKYLKQHPEFRPEQRSTFGGWSQEGPTSVLTYTGSSSALGRINRVNFHPNDSNTVFACTAGGGLWRTPDLGTTWVPMTSHLPLSSTTGFAMDPNNSQIMYLLTGDGDQWDSKSIGVLKSTNSGATWMTTGLTWDIVNNAHVRAYNMVMHPTNSAILFVVSSVGIHKTSNAGVSWSLVRSGYFTDIEFNTADPSIMYAVSNNFYKSTDSGESFQLEGDGDFPSQFNRIEIAVTPADSSVVYLLFGGHVDGTGGGTFSGLYYSDDFGEDFIQKSTTPNILGGSLLGDDSLNQADYDLALAADPFDPDVVYVGGIINWRSINQGSNWQVLTFWTENGFWPFVHADVHQLKFRGVKLFCSTDGGLYGYNTSNGAWANLTEGMCIMQPYDIDVFNDRILLGTQDNGSLRWDVGTSAATAEFGGDGFDCMWDPSPPSGTFGSFYVSWQDELLITNNDGFSFGSISVPGFAQNQYWFLDLIMHPTNHDTIYVGVGRWNSSSDVFRSYNRGGSWTDMNCQLNADITALVQAPSNPNMMFAASATRMVRSNNIHAGSPSWTFLSNLPLSDDSVRITDVLVDPDDPSLIYVCLSQYVDGHKVYMSSDTGSSWQNYTGSLPNVPFYTMVTEDGAANGIYAGCDIGVYYRNANMTDWIYFSNDLPVVPVYDLDTDGSELYAGTFGRGVWSSPMYTTCVNNLVLTSSDPGIGQYVYHTTDYISSTQIIDGGLGTDIRYNSEGFISLEQGFHVKANNLFEVKLGGCPD